MKSDLLPNQSKRPADSQTPFEKKSSVWIKHEVKFDPEWGDWLSWGIFSGVCLNPGGGASLWSAGLPKMDLMSGAAAVSRLGGFHLQSLFALVARGRGGRTGGGGWKKIIGCSIGKQTTALRKHSWKHNFAALTKTSRSITIKLGRQIPLWCNCIFLFVFFLFFFCAVEASTLPVILAQLSTVLSINCLPNWFPSLHQIRHECAGFKYYGCKSKMPTWQRS